MFLGEEYECRQGHRFFCSGPEIFINVPSTSTVKEMNRKLPIMIKSSQHHATCSALRGKKSKIGSVWTATYFPVMSGNQIRIHLSIVSQDLCSKCMVAKLNGVKVQIS